MRLVFGGAAAEIMSRSRDAGVRIQKVPRERLAVMADGGVHQGVVATVRAFDYLDVPDLLEAAQAAGEPALIVVLDGIEDPHNLGAIIRSAHALGAHGVVIPKDRAAQVTGVVAKASAGAIEHTRLARVTNLSRALEQLKEAGLWILAADPSSKDELPDAKLDGPLAVVIGAEGHGVREGVLKHCDFRLKIRVGKPRVSYRETLKTPITMTGECDRQFGATSIFAKVTVEFSNHKTEQPVTVTSQIKPNTINPLLDASGGSGWPDDSMPDPPPCTVCPNRSRTWAESLWLQALEDGRRRALLERASKDRTLARETESMTLRAHVLSLRGYDSDAIR